MTPHPQHLAALDIGSNAIKFKWWRIEPNAEVVLEDFRRYPIRLGASVFESGVLDDAVLLRIERLFKELRDELERESPGCVWRAAATSALREAGNGQSVRDRLLANTGIDIRILSGEQEARLMALGILGRHAQPNRFHRLIDIGGGSTELIHTRGADVLAARSIDIGAVRLRGRCFPNGDPPSPDQREKAEQWLDRILDEKLPPEPVNDEPIDTLGLAGTITTLHKMLAAEGSIPTAEKIIHCDRILDLSERLADLSAAMITERFPIEPDRAEVIFAGSLILRALIRRLAIERIRVVHGGISDGLCEEYLAGR